MPGNSLALQMPPAHQPENFDHSIPIAILSYYIYSQRHRISSPGIPALKTQRATLGPLATRRLTRYSVRKPVPRTSATLPWASCPCCYPTRSPTLPLPNRGKVAGMED